jgi:hypothetical protein
MMGRLIRDLGIGLAAVALGAAVGWLVHPDYEERFAGDVVNINSDQTAVVIETDDGDRLTGLLANDGPPLQVGDSVSGVLMGDEDDPVIRVGPGA